MEPLVSVCVITYNHERYIRECLESIVTQETDFAFEVIVGDDCSTDGTVNVIDEFVEAFPSIVRVIKHESNVGVTANHLATHNAARGQFVAHIDGDDCMLPGKLQQQADFLRAHPGCSMVAHDVEIIDESSAVIASTFSSAPHPTIADVAYLVENGCFFVNSAKMYRRSAARSVVRDRLTVDLFFHIAQTVGGSIGYIAQRLGRYRRLKSGMSSVHSPLRRHVLQGHLDAYEYALANGVDPAIVNRARLNFRYVHAMVFARAGQLGEVRFLSALEDAEVPWATTRQKLAFRSPALAVYLACKICDAVTRRRRRSRKAD